ncbi:MAG: hypothetical protein WCK41_02825 [Actinomycetes bacterium]
MTSPAFRLDLNVATSWLLPAWSAGPVGDERVVLEAAVAAGYQGIQGANPLLCRELGLVPVAFGALPTPGGLSELARNWADMGFDCATLHVGTGIEDDDATNVLVEEVLEASASTGLPLYIETHRATITQDLWRTVHLVERYPELRFNGDFSHWYTGLEMTYGDFDAKLDFVAPVFERVRYMHGRIGSPGCIQIDVGDGDPAQYPSVAHFRSFWTRASAGFLATAGPNETLAFAPELLPAMFGYAITMPTDDGTLVEEGDRWAQGLVLGRIARECFDAAIAERLVAT